MRVKTKVGRRLTLVKAILNAKKANNQMSRSKSMHPRIRLKSQANNSKRINLNQRKKPNLSPLSNRR